MPEYIEHEDKQIEPFSDLIVKKLRLFRFDDKLV